MKRLLLSAGVVLFAACSANQPPVVGAQRQVGLAKQPAAGTLNPTGTVSILDLANGDRATRITVTGLAPNTTYVAHYHLQGSDANANPCTSAGSPIPSSTMTGMSDANGAVTLRNLVARAEVEAATYVNVHTQTAPGTLDAGVACASLR